MKTVLRYLRDALKDRAPSISCCAVLEVDFIFRLVARGQTKCCTKMQKDEEDWLP